MLIKIPRGKGTRVSNRNDCRPNPFVYLDSLCEVGCTTEEEKNCSRRTEEPRLAYESGAI